MTEYYLKYNLKNTKINITKLILEIKKVLNFITGNNKFNNSNREVEEVYGIANSNNTIFLCDIYDSDFEKLSDENIIRTVM